MNDELRTEDYTQMAINSGAYDFWNNEADDVYDADTDIPMTATDLAAAVEANTRPAVESVPAGFNPDEYPLFED